MYFLNEDDLQSLLNIWMKEQEVFSPQMEDDEVMLLPFHNDNFTMDYINFAFPIKEYFFRQKEMLFKWEEKDKIIKLEAPRPKPNDKRIYFGVRPCDAYGIAYMDRFFWMNIEMDFMKTIGVGSIIGVVNCTKAGDNCFCDSMGTGPFCKVGIDLVFTPIDNGYLIETGTKSGEELLSKGMNLLTKVEDNQIKIKIEEKAINGFTKKIIPKNIKKVLESNYENPIWKTLASECVSCTGCTNVCPTCTCFNVVEEKNCNTSGKRVRYWDSCQSDSFTRNAGEHNPRSSEARVKYRLYDKFMYIEERFKYRGCSGCGRCIEVCPAAIDIVEVINKLDGTSQVMKEGK